MKIVTAYDLKPETAYWMYNKEDLSDVELICMTTIPHKGMFPGCEQDIMLTDYQLTHVFVEVGKAPTLTTFELQRMDGTSDKLAAIQLFQEANTGRKFPDNIEGYWRAKINERTSYESPEQANYPWPVAVEVEGFDKDAFISKLTLLETKENRHLYRGISINRITSECNGCAEYDVKGWRWPEGFKEYIKLGVPPSRAFYKFVTGEELDTLPTYGR